MRKTIASLFFTAVIFFSTGCGAKFNITEENAMELFGCAAFLLDEKMTSTEVTKLYLKETEQGKADGYTPVILALDRRVREMIDSNVLGFAAPEEFRKKMLSDTGGGKELLNRQYAKLKDTFDNDETIFAESDERLDARLNTTRTAPKELWSVKNSVDMMVDGEGVYLVRVPTADPWAVTAWLPFCNWNECPSVGDMLKICRFWYENYGAAPAFISGDTMLFWLDEPISDRQTARDISHQHAVFCPEFLGMTGLDSQTADIMISNIWSFWWD